jgi:hypothetical protein
MIELTPLELAMCKAIAVAARVLGELDNNGRVTAETHEKLRAALAGVDAAKTTVYT